MLEARSVHRDTFYIKNNYAASLPEKCQRQYGPSICRVHGVLHAAKVALVLKKHQGALKKQDVRGGVDGMHLPCPYTERP